MLFGRVVPEQAGKSPEKRIKNDKLVTGVHRRRVSRSRISWKTIAEVLSLRAIHYLNKLPSKGFEPIAKQAFLASSGSSSRLESRKWGRFENKIPNDPL